jgi:chromosome segregation ATPase
MPSINLEYILLFFTVVVAAGIVFALNRQQGISDVSDLKTLRKKVETQGEQIDFLLNQIAELKTWTTTLQMERDIARREAGELRKDLDRLRAQMGLVS